MNIVVVGVITFLLGVAIGSIVSANEFCEKLDDYKRIIKIRDAQINELKNNMIIEIHDEDQPDYFTSF